MAGRGRESMGNRVAVEHLRLDSLFAATLAELQKPGEAATALDAFVRLRDHLESHLVREEELYFPALRSLRPTHRQALATLVAAHDAFRGRLATIEASLVGGARVGAARGLESLSGLFAAHEVAEERMLHQIEQELHAESIPSAC